MGSEKSHSAAAVIVGYGPILVSSSKQHIVTKSGTESELVATSGYASAAIHHKNFLEDQSYIILCSVMQEFYVHHHSTEARKTISDWSTTH